MRRLTLGSQMRVERRETRLRRALLNFRPDSAGALHGWVRAALGIEVPVMPRCPGHSAPMAYLNHVFFEQPGD